MKTVVIELPFSTDAAIVEEASKILAILEAAPGAGNKTLYMLYRESGGIASWKVFRRTIGLIRGTEPEPEELVEEKDEPVRVNKGGKMATIRREELKRGQDVWVRVRYAGNHMKLRPARVSEVMRAAVIVSIEGEDAPRTVRFNEIDLDYNPDKAHAPPPPEPSGLTAVPPAFAALADGRGVRAVERPQPVVERRHGGNGYQMPRAAKPSEPDAVDELLSQATVRSSPVPPPSTTEDTLGKVNAWIEQGSAMRENLVKQQASLQASMDDLAAEALRIEEAVASKRAELARVTSLLVALDQMRAAAAA